MLEIPSNIDFTDNLMMLSAVIGFVLPLIIAVVQQPTWPEWARSLVLFVFAALVAVAVCAIKGWFDPQNIVGSFLTTFVVAIGFYQGFWKKTGIAPSVERATSKSESHG